MTREERARLERLKDRFGENLVQKTCKVSRIAFARALAGLGVRGGTIALIQQGIAALEARQALEAQATSGQATSAPTTTAA